MELLGTDPWPWLWGAVALAAAAAGIALWLREDAGSRSVAASLVVTIAALAASLTAAAGAGPPVQATTAAGTAAVLALVLARWDGIARRGSGLPPGVGGGRLVGATGVVRHPAATPDATALVRVLGDDWGLLAEPDPPLRAGEQVHVVAVHGTRLVVERVRPPGDAPRDTPPSDGPTAPGAP